MMRMIWDIPFHIRIILTLLLCVFAAQVFAACIHDSVQRSDTPQAVVSYDYEDTMIQPRDQRVFTERTKYQNRARRAPQEKYRKYQPIRITVSFQDSNFPLTSTAESLYKSVVNNVVKKASSILSVIRVSGNLRLTRKDGCLLTYRSGPNKGECAEMARNYKGEFCADNFKIPDDHLDGLYIYGKKAGVNRTAIAPGEGLRKTDFVLYVKASSTPTCENPGQNIIAYGAYCQLDQNNRPIAGHINFCPSIFQKSERKIYDVALHELFHTLGFTKKLYSKFKDCSQSDLGTECPTRRNVIRNVSGYKRLVTPSVVNRTRRHFDCHSKDNFGAILESQGSEVGSHWDAAFLQGSIMTSNIRDSELTFLDKITLAAFEDMGWYKVNYSQAEHYSWGKGEGCGFGVKCNEDNGYFCISTGQQMCHYLHLYKGECKTDPFLRSCQIYQHISNEGLCSNTTPASINHAAGEIYKKSSRCFVGNLTANNQPGTVNTAGYCYQTRCTRENRLEVRVAGSAWTRCPFGRTIKIKGYSGILRCPLQGVLCVPRPRRQVSPLSSPSPTQSTTTEASVTRPQSAEPKQPEILCIEITFPTADYDVLKSKRLLTAFEQKVAQLVQENTKITEERMKNVHSKRGSVIFIFDLLAKLTEGDGPPSAEVYDILESKVSSRGFTVRLSPDMAFTAALIRSMLPNNVTEKANLIPAGGIVGIVLGTMAAMVLIVAGICLVNKYQMARSRVSPSPSRTPSVDMSDNVSRNTITTLRAVSITHAHSMHSDSMELQQV